MKTLIGTVISTKMSQAVVIKVDRPWTHPLYKKTIKRSKKYLSRTDIKLKVGDQVVITPTRPLSRKIRWQVKEKLS